MPPITPPTIPPTAAGPVCMCVGGGEGRYNISVHMKGMHTLRLKHEC